MGWQSRFKEDLKTDSLNAVELIMSLEEEFGIKILDKDAERMKKVQDVIGYLERKFTAG